MINPENTTMELNVRTIRTFLSAFEEIYGRSELVKLIEGTGMTLAYLEDENNWISFNYYCSVLNAIKDYTNDPEITYKFGLTAGINKSWGIIKIIITSFASCAFTYKTVISLSPRWTKSGTFKFIKFKRNKATIQLTLMKGLKQNKYNCLGIQGQLASIPIYYNLPPAKIRETQCAADGAESCIYEISWKNPPNNKIGLYFLTAGLIISAIAFVFKHFAVLILPAIPYILLGISFIIFILTHQIGNIKQIIKKDSSRKETSNKVLEERLIEIEKINEKMQDIIEEKTREMREYNKHKEASIKDYITHEKNLIQTEKMSMTGGVASSTALSLRAPVELIKENLQNTIGKTSADDPFYDSLKGALKAIDRCENIVNTLYSFSNNGTLFSNNVNINKVIEKSAGKAAEEISSPDIQIITKLDNDLPAIKGDYNQLEQAISVILMNAADAITEAFNKYDKKEGKIIIKSKLRKNDILITISDTGCGIPDEVINKIFDPFYSTKTGSRRKGIGLTISYNTIKKMGGIIDVKSIPGTGTTFLISLPM